MRIKMALNLGRITLRLFFWSSSQNWSVWEEIYKLLPANFSSMFEEIRAKIFCTPKNLPTPTPMSNGLIVSALAGSVKLASRRGCSFCNYRLLKEFISYRNLFNFLLRLVFLKGPTFQSQTHGMPIYTNVINFYTVCFWLRDNQHYSKTSYISTRTNSMLYCGLSHVQL